MTDPVTSLTAFLRHYEQAANSHDVGRVVELIANDAVFWFSDGSHRGLDEIAQALSRTFATIRDETYEIREPEWVVVAADHAVCRCRFSWTGMVDGLRRSGEGRGTNVVVRRGGDWKVLHEHLSVRMPPRAHH